MLSRLFDLKHDQASPDAIDSAIRAAGQVSGTNMWVLMFAIIIASVGLNVNSTATIIGAMLISPLMGPILGVGYGAGINDFALIRRSLRNLATFAVISLLTSTLYFLVTPLQDAQSELLARTTPNIWDVLIAFFGGAAGMVGLTRKEKSTTIPGVAIATALMPPLCTVGYGIATGQPRFFLGAFYLFAINGVFIALATLTITRVLRLPLHKFADPAASGRARVIIGFIVTITLVPSVFLAAKLVTEQVFVGEAQRYIRAVSTSEKTLIITSSDVDTEQKIISLYVIGADSLDAAQQAMQARLAEFKLAGATLDLHLASATQRPDPANFRADNDASRALQQKLDQQLVQIRALQETADRAKAAEALYAQVASEVQAQYPQLKKVLVAREVQAGGTDAKSSVLVVLETAKPLAKQDMQRLQNWLTLRLPQVPVSVLEVTRGTKRK
jgi:uncharacterized hydrophobic protein (TIGR00271 family)